MYIDAGSEILDQQYRPAGLARRTEEKEIIHDQPGSTGCSAAQDARGSVGL